MVEPTPEQRSQARGFVQGRLTLDTSALTSALTGAYGDAWTVGALAGADQTGATVVAGLDGVSVPDNWDRYWDAWQPGNLDAAVKLTGSGFADLLNQADVTIQGVAGTTLDRFGSILADGVANGLSVDDIASNLGAYLDDPGRAFTIADTEVARAVTSASLDQYLAQGVVSVAWLDSPGACPICVDNAAAGPYPLADFPDLPAHPECRCSSAPVGV